MTRTHIVTTTINKPTKATKRLVELVRRSFDHSWKFYVVGDKKTPHELYEQLDGVVYIHPDEQEKKYKELSDAIGWNSIQRRNIGFVEAYNNSNPGDIIATIDDDNIPDYSWSGSSIRVGIQDLPVRHYIPHNNLVFDPISITSCGDKLWHRGFPIELLQNRTAHISTVERVNVLVQADFWNGDPDIDAIARLTHKPCVDFSRDQHLFPFTSEYIHPFNSQNTFLDRSVIKHYAVWPFIGRMDDIWGGYYLQTKINPNQIIYGSPSVVQERNEQDLITNLENEIIGYRNTLNWLQDGMPLTSKYLPDKTLNFLDIYFNQYAKSC